MKFLISFLIGWFLLAEYFNFLSLTVTDSVKQWIGFFFCGILMIAHESFYLLSNFTWLLNMHIHVDVLVSVIHWANDLEAS